MIKSLARSVLILLAALGTTTALRAQNYPLPASTPNTAVACDPAPANPANPRGQCPFAQAPSTPGYQLPIKTFTGRYLDATWTPDYQCGFRTSRSGLITFSPDGTRVYFQIGSGVVAYSTSTFFTQRLGQPLVSINNLGNSLGISRVRFCGNGGGFVENYLPWDRFSYFESFKSGFDFSNGGDGQDRLTGYDVDDRANIYSAAFIYGWGISHDDGGTDGALMSYVSQRTLANNLGVASNSIFAVKASGRYYAVVGAQRASQAAVWDVTDARNPVAVGIRAIPLPDTIVHSADGSRLAMVSPDTGGISIYTADGYINGASPIFRAASSGRSFGQGVATDGSNFFAAESGPGVPLRFHTFTPQGLTYSDAQVDTTEVFNAFHVNYDSGFLTVTGTSPKGFDVRLFRVISPTTFRNVDLNGYIQNYYFAAPPGFTAASSLGKISLADAIAHKHTNGKTYLIISAGSLGDVYELQTADSITPAVRRFGETANPNAPVSASANPVYGDKVVFAGSATAPAPFQVNWTFGNPETSDNSNLSILSNAEVTHQFGGLTAAGIAGPKLVTVTSLLDPTVSGSFQLQLRTPTARVGLQSAGIPVSILGSQASSAILSSDSFVDASDGSVEGHFSSWTVDGQTTQAAPSAPVSVGTCGARVMSMIAHYGPYASTGSTLSTVPAEADFPLTVGPINYNAVPFIASVNPPSSSPAGDSVVFTGAIRTTTTASAFAGAPSFTYHWDLVNAAGTAIRSSATSVVGVGGGIAPFSLPNGDVTSNPGSTARLSVFMAPELLSPACAPFASTVASSAALNPPDPKVVPTGCTVTNIPCSLTATSISGNESDWLSNGYIWTIDGSVDPAHTKTISATLLESLGVPHSITVTVTNSFTRATSAPLTITTQKPACSGVPTNANISVSYIGNQSGCPSAACKAGEDVQFFVRSIVIGGGGVGGIYPFSDTCDKYAWNFGDGTTSTERNPLHKFVGDASSYNVTMTIDGSTGAPALTVPLTVSFGVVTPPPPPPTCTAPNQFSVRIVQRGQASGCTQGVPCSKNEGINFDLAPQIGSFDFTCGNPQFAWSFDDAGATAQGKSVNHSFATSRTYDVSVQFTNSQGGTTLHVPVIISDSTTPVPSACGTDPSPNNTTLTYNQPTGGGCTESNRQACNAGSAVSLALATVRYSLDTCYSVSWHFDDGTPDSAVLTPTHIFVGNKSTYAVTATITGGASGAATFHANLNFGNSTPADPIPTFTVSPDSPTNGQTVTFTHTNASARAVKWSWDFGDTRSQTGPDKSVTHIYTSPGTYAVTLSVIDASGATIGSKVQTVTVTLPKITKRRGGRH